LLFSLPSPFQFGVDRSVDFLGLCFGE